MQIEYPESVRPLYLTSPDGEELQFCFMRPTAEELCPELPFMIEAPRLSLENFGLPSRLIGHEDVLLPQTAASAAATAAAAAAAAAPVEPGDAHAAPAGASELVHRAETALARDEPLPAELSQLLAEDWRALFRDRASGDEPFFGAASAAQLKRLAQESGSEALADLLLWHALPRFLLAVPQQQPPLQQQGDALPPPQEPAALPAELAELLTVLLQAGSRLRSAPPDFDADVLETLRIHRPFGRAAAMHASFAYVAARQAQAQARRERAQAQHEESGAGGIRQT